MHRQIKVVAILLIVEGSLEVLAGLFLCVMGPTVKAMFESGTPPPTMGGGPPPNPEMIGAVYIIMGIIALVAAIPKIVAGIRNLSLKGRALGFVGLGSCLLSLGTCYCSLFALALGIYGLIVYVNERSAQAFKLVEGGMSAEQAIAQVDGMTFGAAPPAPPPDQYPPYPPT
jgi:hypothetical protein